MQSRLWRLVRGRGQPNYYVFFVTARCNAKCGMCFYMTNMEKSSGKADELSLDEYRQISRSIPFINILGISGGEPFLREDLADIIQVFYHQCHPLVVDLPTNGTLVESVVRQVEAIARNCPDMVVDVQLSLDGPEALHNQIRGLRQGFARVQECYHRLLEVRRRYGNLRLKACVVYSSYNQHSMEELFTVLHRDFSQLDRIVFSVVHGSAWDKQAVEVDWARYFALCQQLERTTPIDILDFHSLFTFALRAVKNQQLIYHLGRQDFYRYCQAGKKVIVVGETGQVFPCEPLWQGVGDLRQNGYDLPAILRSPAMQAFQEEIIAKKCNCHWGLPMSNNLVSQPLSYPRLLAAMARLVAYRLGRRFTAGGTHGSQP